MYILLYVSNLGTEVTQVLREKTPSSCSAGKSVLCKQRQSKKVAHMQGIKNQGLPNFYNSNYFLFQSFGTLKSDSLTYQLKIQSWEPITRTESQNGLGTIVSVV